MKANKTNTVRSKEQLVAEALGARILRGKKAALRRYHKLMVTDVPALQRIIAREQSQLNGRGNTKTCLATLSAAYDAAHGGDATTADIARWARSNSIPRLARSAVACMTAHFAG